MSEHTGIDLLAVQVKACTGFDRYNVSLSNWKVLNSGNSDHYAIIRPGPATRTASALTAKQNTYRTVIEVWQRYVDDGTTLTALLDWVDVIVARLDSYRKLADTTGELRDANVTALGDVTEQWREKGNGPSWLRREIVVEWVEEEVITYAE